MAQSIAVSRVPSAPPAGVDLHRGTIHWRCLPDYRALVESSRLDWQDLQPADGLEEIKSNAHRSVWRARLDGRPLFVKVYRPRGAWSHLKLWFRGPTAAQEWEVGQYAASFGLPTVRPVACGWLESRARSGPSWLVTDAVTDAIALNDYWLSVRHDHAASRQIIGVVARLVARAHQCGFHHRDMHAGNILVTHAAGGMPEALFVDLHDVRIGHRVPIGSVLANLAQLNQWFRRHASRSQRLMFLLEYLRARDQFATISPKAVNWQTDLRELLTDLLRRADRHAEALWAKRDRRARRDGRYYCRLHIGRWSGLALRKSKHPRPGSRLTGLTMERHLWRDLLNDPLSWLQPERASALKQSHSGTVCRAELQIGDTRLPVVVKRPLPRDWIKRLTGWLRPSRNMHTWRTAHQLVHRDLPTSEPLAIVERRALGLFRSDSLLLTEFVEGACDLETYLAREVAGMDAASHRRAKDRLIETLVRLLRDFHARGFIHRDLKAPNLLVCPPAQPGDDPRLVFIDLDGVFHRPARVHADHLWRAVARLNVSLLHVASVTRTDRMRFVRRMLLSPGRSDRDWRFCWHDLAAATDKKQREKLRRRQWKLDHYGRE